MSIEDLEKLKQFLENGFVLMNYEQTYDFLCIRTSFTDEELHYANALKSQSV